MRDFVDDHKRPYLRELLDRLTSPHYSEVTKDAESVVKHIRAAEEARALADPELIPLLMSELKHSRDKYRCASTYACLAAIGHNANRLDVTEALLHGLHHEKRVYVLGSIVKGLGQVPLGVHTHAVVERLHQLLDSRQALLRFEAADALRMIGSPISAVALVDRLPHITDTHAQWNILCVLLKCGSPSMIEKVLPYTESNSKEVAYMATNCIGTWCGGAASPLLGELLDRSKYGKHAAMSILAESGDETALDAVVRRTRALIRRPPRGDWWPCSELGRGLAYLSRHQWNEEAAGVLSAARSAWHHFHEADRHWLKANLSNFVDMSANA